MSVQFRSSLKAGVCWYLEQCGSIPSGTDRKDSGGHENFQPERNPKCHTLTSGPLLLNSSGKPQEVHVPGRAVGAALLELHRETVGLLHGKEDLLALAFIWGLQAQRIYDWNWGNILADLADKDPSSNPKSDTSAGSAATACNGA